MAEGTGGDADIEGLYQSIVDNHPQWRERKQEIKRELLGEASGTEAEIQPRVQEAIETEKDHDELLQSTISAFDPRGHVCERTGWRILTSEPLVEKNLPNADALIGHLDRNWAILVECKTGLSKPGRALEQLFDAAEKVREHREHLEVETGLSIETVDCVVCVPSELDWRIAETIQEYERNGDDREQVYIWRLNRFSGETLQLYENIDTREPGEATHDHELTEVLSHEGVRIAGESEVTPAFFPSSHLANIIEVAFSEVLWNREKEEEPVTKFTKSELTDVLTSENTLLHYSRDTIGKRIRDEVIPRLLEHGLIEPYGEDEPHDWKEIEVFEYGIGGRTTQTILANLTDEYFEAEVDAIAESEARERAVELFREEVGSLDRFESDGE